MGHDTDDKQRAFLEQQARTQAAAVDLLKRATGMGIEPLEAISALLTAATSLIDIRFKGADRLNVLNALLAATSEDWGGLVAVETIQ